MNESNRLPHSRISSDMFAASEGAPANAAGGEHSNSEAAWMQLVNVLIRRKWIVLSILCLVVAVTAVLAFNLPPIYEADSTFRVQQQGQRIKGIEEFRLSDITGLDVMATHCQTIKSNSVLSAALSKPGITELPTFADEERPLELLKDKVEAKPVERAQIVRVSYASKFPQDAAAITNAVVEAYLDFNASTQQSQANKTRDDLITKSKELREWLDEKEEELIDYKKAYGILSFGKGSDNIVMERLGELNRAKTQSEIERIQYEAQLETMRGLVNNDNLGATLMAVSPSDTNAATAHNFQGLYATLRSNALEEEQNIFDLQTELGDDHPMVIAATDRLNAANESIHVAQKEAIEAQLAILTQRVQNSRRVYTMLASAFEEQKILAMDLNARAVEFAALETEVTRTQEHYELVISSIKGIDISETVDLANVTIIDMAAVPEEPAGPKKMVMIAMACIFGLLLGCGSGLLVERLDNSLRTPDDVTAHLKVPVIGWVPSMNHLMGEGEDDPQIRGMRSFLVPRSKEAEAYRSIRTAVFFSAGKDRLKRLLVTSPMPGDGKSTMASNLAISMAASGKRVILIDADSRRPRQHRIFGRENTRGLNNILVGEAELEEAVIHTQVDGMDLLPCGTIPPNPAELLNSDAFRQLVETLGEHYDKVIVDSPPVLAVTDASIIGTCVDGALLVLRSGKNTRSAASKAKEQLLSVGTRLLGVALNDVNLARNGYGSYHGQYYYEYYEGDQVDQRQPRRRERKDEPAVGTKVA